MSRLRPQDAEKRAQRANGDFSEALARGLSIINAFDDQRRQMTLSDVARAIDLPRATARRALTTLVGLGYVESEGRLFRLAPRILKLAIAYLSSDPVPSVLQPVCERISRQVHASCSVAVLDGEDAVMIARAVPARPTSVGLGVGYRVPVFCSALGRVLASALLVGCLFVAKMSAVLIVPVAAILEIAGSSKCTPCASQTSGPSQPIWASEHACSPLPADGSTVIPSGSVTTARPSTARAPRRAARDPPAPERRARASRHLSALAPRRARPGAAGR